MGISNGVKDLVQKLKLDGVLKTPLLIESFLSNDRIFFVPKSMKAEAYVDAPLPTYEGQTISQPYTVAFMLELLDPKPGQKVLDIGFGSGWTTALLAYIVGREGKIFGLEIASKLYEFGKANLSRFKYQNIELRNQSGFWGFAEAAPFERILVSAAAPEVPKDLKDQLAIGGRMVIPVNGGALRHGQSIVLIKKLGRDKFEEQKYPGFAFVPLVKKSK